MLRLLAALVIWFMCYFPAAAQHTGEGSPENSSGMNVKLADTNGIKALLANGKRYLEKPPPLKKVSDTALLFLNQALDLSRANHSDVWEARVQQYIGLYFLRDDETITRGKNHFLKAIGYYRKAADKKAEAEAWNMLGEGIPFSPSQNLPDKAQSFENARSLYHQLNHLVESTNALKNMAEVHMYEDQLELAEKELLQALENYKAAGVKKLHFTYDLLAEVSKRKVDLSKELLYRQEGIRSMLAASDTAMADFFYSKLALVYADLNMYDKSEEWILKSLDVLKKRYSFGDYYGELSLLIYDYIKSGQAQKAIACLEKTVREVPPENMAQKVDCNEMFGNCYVALKEYGKAEQYYLAMMRDYKITSFSGDFYSTNAQMVTDYIHYYQAMADFYILTGKYAQAGYYVKKVLDLPPGTVRPITLYKFHYMQFQVDSATGRYIPAIRHFELHKRINDSLFDATRMKQISELQVKYETREKEQSIAVLKAQSKSEHAGLQNVSLQRNITIAGIAMLLVVAGLAYNGYRNKQRSNRQLQIKQEEINKQNQSLQHLLKEKEWLLKEVHHRVKNNLQIIISLLNAQTDFLDNPSALHAIQESRERMQAIALIHQKLYQLEHSTLINIRSYIQELVSYLESSFTSARRIYFHLDIEPINLDVSQAVPLGLILNEAITNSVKYAFPEGKHGVISVLLERGEGDHIQLTIADNGIGLPPGFDVTANNTLGIKLIYLFTEQLEGKLSIRNADGVEIILSFTQEYFADSVLS